jgi:DNA-3-methyladenine glycosylase I
MTAGRSVEPTRCPWAADDALNRDYHDVEWGVPLHEPRALFELLCLEGAQAGLSWTTILRKRDGFRAAFDGFDPARIARYTDDDRARLMADAGIVRNRAKIDAFIGNAHAWRQIEDPVGLLWSFVGGRPRQNRWSAMGQLPAETEESRGISRELRRIGFSFVGPTICYAFMQSAGLVNDHLVSCFRYEELGGHAASGDDPSQPRPPKPTARSGRSTIGCE